MSNIKNIIDEWNTYDNNIKKINKYLKEQKDKKDKLEEDILNFIVNNNLEDKKINYKNIILSYKLNQTIAPLNVKLLDDVLSELFTTEIKNKVLDKIHQKRNSNKKTSNTLKKKIINN